MTEPSLVTNVGKLYAGLLPDSYLNKTVIVLSRL